MKSVSFLKFPDQQPEAVPVLQDEGVRVISALAPPVRVVTFVGDSRCGKSSLASALAGDMDTFGSGGGTDPVTTGIDACVLPFESGGHLVILDCEGSNSPSAPASVAVDVLSMLCSTLIVQVVWGQLGEHQLQSVGVSLAARDAMPVLDTGGMQLPPQRLVFLVNADHLGHGPNDLERAMGTGDAKSPRGELRQKIRSSYLSTQLVSVPYTPPSDSLREAIEPLQAVIQKDCAPVSLGSLPVSGMHLVEMASTIVRRLAARKSISLPYVYRHIIFDQHLQPLVARIAAGFQNQLPPLQDYDPKLTVLYDKRMQKLQQFDRETEHISCRDMVAEARTTLRNALDQCWEEIVVLNAAFGMQVKYQTAEFDAKWKHTEVQVIGFKRCCLIGPKRPKTGSVKIYEEITRVRSILKDGREEVTPWKHTGRTLEVVPGKREPRHRKEDLDVGRDESCTYYSATSRDLYSAASSDLCNVSLLNDKSMSPRLSYRSSAESYSSSRGEAQSLGSK